MSITTRARGHITEESGSSRGRRNWQLAAAASLAVLATAPVACGFRLQGALGWPAELAVTYIAAPDPYSELVTGLRRSLRASGSRIASVQQEATAVLRINRDETGSRVLSVSSVGVPLEFEIFYTVNYELSAGDKLLIEPETVTLTRDYTFDGSDVLSKAKEEEFLTQALAQDIVRLINRRLVSLPRGAAEVSREL